VTRGEHETYVKPFPISVAPEFVDDPVASRGPSCCDAWHHRRVHRVGVERIDYTKGIPDASARCASSRDVSGVSRAPRVRAARRAQPLDLKRYQDIQHESRTPCARSPDVSDQDLAAHLYLKAHHEHRGHLGLLTGTRLLHVTSLHDGMTWSRRSSSRSATTRTAP